MITFGEAILLGLLQGLTELFPISSLGHMVIIPRLLGWNIHQNDPFFLNFLVATHFATALVLFFMFWKDWQRIFKGFFTSLQTREIKDPDAKLAWLLIVATIPAGILGLLFEDQIRSVFVSAQSAAFFLTLNGVLLFITEIIRKRKAQQSKDSDRRIAHTSWLQSIEIGFLQAIALIPGFSRTGATIAGGLLAGLTHEDALHFSFLLATPIIGAAALLKLPEFATKQGMIELPSALVGAVAAGIAAYFSAKFLTRYFQTKTLLPFAIYCFLAGIITSIIFLFH